MLSGSTAVRRILLVLRCLGTINEYLGSIYTGPADADSLVFPRSLAQRAHANFIENQPTFLSLLAVSGLRYPVAAAALGATWMFGRVAYGMGYASSRGPEGRVL